MSTRLAYTFTVSQRLTENGQRGVLLIIGSPIVEAVGVAWALNKPFSDPSWLPWLLITAGGVAFFTGWVLLLTGREYIGSAIEMMQSQPSQPHPLPQPATRR